MEKDNETELPKTGIRLNKYVANAGIASRRKADNLIKEGFVKVNDVVILAMGFRVQPDDVVKFKDKLITINVNKVYILMNKPKNTITTTSDEKGRKTVMDLVKNVVKERIYPVGRLDRQTVGLLLLTNDGELALKLAHPSFVIKKIYHVTLDKDVTSEHIKMIKAGLTLEDGFTPVDTLQYMKDKGKNEVGIEIHIGRNRIVRRIFEHLGYEVKKLDRIYYSGLSKKDLPRGRFRHLTSQEVIMLKHFTGKQNVAKKKR